MRSAEHIELLGRLPRHNWKAITRRANQLNKLLKQILTISRMHCYTVGRLWLPKTYTDTQLDAEAKRLTLIIGVGHFLRYAGHSLHRNVEYVNDAMKLTHETLDKIALPQSYRSEQFAVLVRG
jgi:hypothetical protein